MTVAYFTEMHEEPPQGARGGHPGMRSDVAKIRRDGSIEALPPIGLVELQPGEFIRGNECGGGGYGDPRQRDPLRVLQDVREGWVSQAKARQEYGVMITGDLEAGTLAIDCDATDELRGEGAARRGGDVRQGGRGRHGKGSGARG